MTGLDMLPPEQRRLFIGGKWRDAGEGETFDVLDPADGSVLTPVADGTVGDAVDALDAAVGAQAGWAATPPRERGEILRRAFEAINDRADDLALLMSLEMGKTVKEAKGEVAYGNEFFRWYAEEAVRIHGRWMQAPAGGSRLLTIKKPVGPCLFVTPWNFPIAMGTRKIGPAVAAGCTMVVKPAQQTPLTMLALAAILQEVGLPDGVLNIVPTTRAADLSKTLQADDRLRKVSFTGSTGIGRVMVRQSADQLQRVSMELGGNAPFIVFDDADLEAALDGAMVAKMRNAGEACTAANRIYVQSGIHDAFAEGLRKRMTALKVGAGVEAATECGPMITKKAVDKIDRLVQNAVARGARVLCGGSVGSETGFYYPPTVLCDVPADAAIAQEEIFGPVAPISRFEQESEAIERANDTEYGLAAYIYTRDLARGMRVAAKIEAGMIALNRGLMSDPAAPFGGVKQSGIGREGGQGHGIAEFMEAKYLAVAM